MPVDLRVGLVGANPHGGWAREAHVPALRALDGIDLVAIAGRDQRGADVAAEAFGVGKAFASMEAMVRDGEIDLVAVVATLPSHRALLLPALAAGKHIFCEYPLGLDALENRALAAAAAESGRCHAIGLQARTNPAVGLAQNLLASGAIGRVLTARILSTTAGFGSAVDPFVAYTEVPANGVTLVTIQAAHTIDLAIALLGGLTAIEAMSSTQFPMIRIGDGPATPRETADHLLLLGRTAGGAALSVEVAGGRTGSTPFRCEVIGESGQLVLEGGAPRGFQAGRLSVTLNGVPQTVDEGPLASLPDPVLNVATRYAALRDQIVRGSPASVGFDHAARLARLIDDAARSARTGQRIEAGDWPLG